MAAYADQRRLKFLFYLAPYTREPIWKGRLYWWAPFVRLCEDLSFDYYFLTNECLSDSVNALNFDKRKFVFTSGTEYSFLSGDWAYRLHNGLPLGNRGDLEESVRSALPSGFDPDVIFCADIDRFFETLFPSAVCIYNEVGLYSRRPAPATLFFDPLGYFSNSLMAQIAMADAVADQLTEACQLAPILREAIVQRLSLEIAKSAEERPRQPHGHDNHVRLFPIQKLSHWYIRSETTLRTIEDTIGAAMEGIPSGGTLWVSGMPGRLSPAQEQDLQRFGSDRLVFASNTDKSAPSTQARIPQCDDVWTINSTVGLQGVLFGKRLITPTGSMLRGLASETWDGSACTETGLPQSQIDRRLAWLLSRYHLPFRTWKRPEIAQRYIQLCYLLKHGLISLEGFFATPFAPIDQIAADYRAR